MGQSENNADARGGVSAVRRANELADSPGGSSAVDFVIVTPLGEERDAMLEKLAGYRQLPPCEQDIRVYYAADIRLHSQTVRDRNTQLLLCHLRTWPYGGGDGHGRCFASMATSLRIAGRIAGGIAKAGVRIGDVLVADQIADYELQKIENGKSSIRWQVHRADQRLLIAAQNFRRYDWRQTTARRYDKQETTVHFGRFAPATR